MIIIGRILSINDLVNQLKSFKKPQRENVKIALIDDEPFQGLERLQRNDYKIKQFEDIYDISTVSEFEIVLVDIDGVGKTLSENYQGAFILQEIRKKYPYKIIIAYSSKTFDASYNKYFRNADFIFRKDLTTEQWVENLDQAIAYAIDPLYQWKKLRDYLLANDVKLVNVLKVEDNFVKCILRRESEFPNKSISNSLKNETISILKDFAKSLLFKSLLG